MKNPLVLIIILVLIVAGVLTGAFLAFSYVSVASRPLVSVEDILAMAQKEDYGDAIKSCQKRLLVDPDEYGTSLLLGTLYEETDALGKALKIHQKLLKTNPDIPEPLFYLGRVYYRQNKIDEAIDHLKRFIASAKGSSDKELVATAHGLLSDIYLEFTREYRKATYLLEKFLESDSQHWEMRYQLGVAYSYAGQYANAFTEFNKIMKENPDTEIAKYAENAIQYVRERRHPSKSRYVML